MKELLSELEELARLKLHISEITFWLVLAYVFIIILIFAIALLFYRNEF